MHPAVMNWWRARAYAGRCGPGVGCGPSGEWAAGASDDSLPGGFGVRRPLRFLSHKLDLDEKQAAQMARILDELKTERAQATVDDRRVLSAFADAISGTEFDTQSAQQAATRRVQSAERLRDAVVKALTEIHRVLDAEQRERLAYLIRTGALVI